MPKEVIMPVLGMNQDTGVLVKWLKEEGDSVSEGEAVMEVETDKAVTEIESPGSGTLAGIIAQAGEEVPVGQVVALVLAEGESVPDSHGKSAAPAEEPDAAEESAPEPATAAATTEAPRDGKTLASPKARRLAKEQNVDLSSVSGSGPNAAVIAEDVMAAFGGSPGQVLEVSRGWQVMAQRLTQSWTEVPHFYLSRDIDASALQPWRERELAQNAEKVTFTDLLIKAVALSLAEHSRLNASWINDSIVINEDINISLAVAVEDGLLVPVVPKADQLNIGDIAARRKDIVTRALDGSLSLEDMQSGTFTISNLGMFGIDNFNAIVNPPQAAILALGQIADRVVAVDGLPAVRPMMTVTVSCDHRVVDGARAAQFLQTLAQVIDSPPES